MAITPDSVRVDGKVAVVTGAAQGIGKAAALGLHAFGCRSFALCDRQGDKLDSVVAELEGDGSDVVAATIDVRDSDKVTEHIAEVVERFGRIDTLVNNAGGTFWSPFDEVAGKGEAALIAENFTQLTHLVRSCVAHVPDTGGSIINVTSSEAHRAAPGFAIYSAMKAAVANLTKTLALELAPRSITVNCIAPDGIPTEGDMGLQMISNAADRPWQATPLGLGSVDDAAASIVFLASDMARFITGSTLQVNGGAIAAGGWKLMPDGRWTV